MATNQQLMTIENKAEFAAILKKWLEGYVQKGELSDREWLERELAEIIPAEARQKAAAIADMAESINAARESLARARKRGMNRQEWLLRELREAAGDFGDEQLGKFISDFGSGIGATLPKELFSSLPNCDGTLICPEKGVVWNPHTIREAAFIGGGRLERVALVSLAALEGELAGDTSPRGEGSPLSGKVADVLLGDHAVGAVMAVAGALEDSVSRKNLVLNLFDRERPGHHADANALLGTASVVGIAHRIVRTTNINYRVGSEKISAEEAVNEYIDIAAETASGIVREFCREGGARLGELGGALVGSLVSRLAGPGAVEFCKNVGRGVGEYLGDKVGAFVEEGIKKVASKAKEVFTRTVEWANEKAIAFKDAIFDFFSW